MFCIFFVLLFTSCLGAEDIVISSNRTDNILCRGCGTQILTVDSIISKSSAASLYSFNDTIFNKKQILVQLLIRGIFLQQPVITSSDSSCLGKGDWEDDDLWFPDYALKPCFCPECGAFLGWMFKNESPVMAHSNDTFFGIILSNIIGETCKYFQNSFGRDCFWGNVLFVCIPFIGFCPFCAYQNNLISVAYDNCCKVTNSLIKYPNSIQI